MFRDQSLNVLQCRRSLLLRGWFPAPGAYREDQCCPRTVQAALAADGDGTLEVRTALIVAGSTSGRKERLVHPPGITLQQRNREEKLALQHEVLLGD